MPYPRLAFTPVVVSFVCVLACGPQNGARPLEEVRKDTAALRSRVLLELARSVSFPHCNERPEPGYPCGLLADRDAERAIAAACAGQPACTRDRLAALYAQIQERAESLDVGAAAVLARCGARCRDLKALELEILRTAAAHAERQARAAFLRADNAEREGIEREREDLKPFATQKRSRDATLEALFTAQKRDIMASERDGASLPHASLCMHTEECEPAAECIRFPNADVGLCQKE